MVLIHMLFSLMTMLWQLMKHTLRGYKHSLLVSIKLFKCTLLPLIVSKWLVILKGMCIPVIRVCLLPDTHMDAQKIVNQTQHCLEVAYRTADRVKWNHRVLAAENPKPLTKMMMFDMTNKENTDNVNMQEELINSLSAGHFFSLPSLIDVGLILLINGQKSKKCLTILFHQAL